MTLEQNKAIVQRFYEELVNQRQFGVVDEIIGEDFRLFSWSEPPFGPAGVRRFMNGLVARYPDLRITIDDLVAEGEKVATHVTIYATQNLPIDYITGFAPIPATGRMFGLQECVFWRLDEGKIVERYRLVDQLDVLRQLGALGFTANFEAD
jgi:predicted ester cyclase